MDSVLLPDFDSLTSTADPIASEAQTTDGKAEFRFGTHVTSTEEDLADRVERNFLDANTGTTEALFADVVIVANASNSNIHNKLHPDVKREYSGYMYWRGTVREGDIDEKWNALYSEKAITPHEQDISSEVGFPCNLLGHLS